MADKKTAKAGAEITTSDKNKSAGASSGKKADFRNYTPRYSQTLCFCFPSSRPRENKP